jgi:hypothetical protein
MTPTQHHLFQDPPELELGAATALIAQAEPLRAHAAAIVELVCELSAPARAALSGEIRALPTDARGDYDVAAVDSSHNPVSTVGLTEVIFAAFRTSEVASEDFRVASVQLEAGAEIEAVARLVRCHLEADLLCAPDAADRILILDNSYLSVAESATRALLARQRAEPGSLEAAALDRYVALHVHPGGSLPRMLGCAHVVAVPKVSRATGLLRDLVRALPDQLARRLEAAALNDRMMLRYVLEPGEYLATRPLVAGQTEHTARSRFFHNIDVPGRGELMERFGIGVADSSETGLDVVYFRPTPAPDGPAPGVLRVECQRAVTRSQPRLHRLLRSLERTLDGEHPEPAPQLLADHLARGAVRTIPAALTQAALGDLAAAYADPFALSVTYTLFEAARS